MTDFQELIRTLQNDLDETKQQLKRKEKQIDSLKKTNKIQEAHVELQRKKITELENRRQSVVMEEDSSRVQQLTNSIARLNAEIEQLRANNASLSFQFDRFRQENSNIIKKYEAQVKNLIEKSRLDKSKFEGGSKEYQKRINILESQLAKAKRKIQESSISANVSNPNHSTVLNIANDYEPASILRSNAPSKIHFYDAVPLTESLNEDHFQIPENHKKLFNLLDIYLQRLMPSEKIKFLNITVADAENKLQKISEEVGFMQDLQQQ